MRGRRFWRCFGVDIDNFVLIVLRVGWGGVVVVVVAA